MREKGVVNGYVPAPKVLGRVTDAMKGRWDDPFFLFIGTVDTHKPYVGHQPWLGRYDQKPYRGRFAKVAGGRQLGIQKGTMRCGYTPVGRDLERVNALYDSALSFQDGALGRFLDDLDQRGLADSTMVIVTSDHGEEFWEDGRCGHGASLRETLIHVPLAIRYPPLVPAGAVVDDGVEVLDVLPTVLDAFGASAGARHGASLLPATRGEVGYARPSYASQYEYAHALRLGDWKLVVGARGKERLRDLKDDPGERRDHARARPVELRLMRDVTRLFLAHRARWRKSLWGVASNLTPAGAEAIEAAVVGSR
jgi:arylsulfatase A-like enzyme